jgi:hypothetical protein
MTAAKTKTTPTFAPASCETFPPSRPFSDRSNCRRAMVVFAGAHAEPLSPDEFDIIKVGPKEFRFQRKPRPIAMEVRTVPLLGDLADTRTLENMAGQPAPLLNDIPTRGVTSAAPKTMPSDIENAIATFNDGIPENLKISQADRKAGWDASPPRQPAKIAARKTELESDMAKKISAQKPAKKSKSGKTRYDWAGAEEAAANGKVPAAPDFSAPTHKYYVPKLAEVVKMVKAADLKGLRAYKINGNNTSPTAIKRYLACALVALTAKAKAAKA